MQPTPSKSHSHRKRKKNAHYAASVSSPPHKKRKSVSFASNVHYFNQKSAIEAMELTTVMDDEMDAIDVNAASRENYPSHSPMEMTETIRATEQHNDDMEMTEVIRGRELGATSPSFLEKLMRESPMKNSRHSTHHEPRDMQMTGDVGRITGGKTHHPSVFDPQIDDDMHSRDEELLRLFSSPHRRSPVATQQNGTVAANGKEGESVQEVTAREVPAGTEEQPTTPQTPARTEDVGITEEAALRRRRSRSPSPSRQRITRQQAMKMVHQPETIATTGESAASSQESSQQSTADAPAHTALPRNSSHSFLNESSRLSLLPGHEDGTPKNLNVDEFLKVLNIRLGSSANFGMKPRSSMYIPTEQEEEQRLTYEQKVHLQSVTSVHFNVIQEACEELHGMTDKAEQQLKQLTQEMNANNPEIFKQVQQLTHGSDEYRRVRQQLTNLKSYARAKNRYEFLKWKISLEQKKDRLIYEEQQKFIDDQHAIEEETKRVREQLHALEEEERKLRQQKEMLQKKLLKESKRRSTAVSAVSAQKPSQTQVLGLMEMMTKNIHSQIMPPNLFRLLYPSLNFSVDVIFKLASNAKDQSTISKIKPSQQAFKATATTSTNPYSEFIEYVLSRIPVGKMFEGVSTPAAFRSTFSAKLHPLLNRLNRLIRNVLDTRKRCPSLVFRFSPPSSDAQDSDKTTFQLVLSNHRDISRVVVEFSVKASNVQFVDQPRVVEFYSARSNVSQQKVEESLAQVWGKSSNRYARFENVIAMMRKMLFPQQE